ncbi:hypothetical protein K1T71_008461 [Dendrolimus kikuchii]|uniref:Uncharacterized protein n=1 Tax=Dendrolimus kikuchii TaxID=765133 RepID=A0ACC1CYT7_9NEOP|nr:hypothetical protein K1T71_008461 [Dendrolimus kikuchii]
MTVYISGHPGGPDSLLDVAGKDGTQPFEDVGHSEDARIMMKKYKIGTLPPGECTKFIETCSRLKWAILALAGAIIVGFVIKKYAS